MEQGDPFPFLRQGRFCVECGEFSARLVLLLLEDGQPHGSPGHQIYYTRISLSQCASCGIGLLERDAHECAGPSESLQRTERRAVWPEDFTKLLASVDDCPRPFDARCDCLLHKSLIESLKIRWTVPFDVRRKQEGKLPRLRLSWKEGLPKFAF